MDKPYGSGGIQYKSGSETIFRREINSTGLTWICRIHDKKLAAYTSFVLNKKIDAVK
jgi:hypothetical protein